MAAPPLRCLPALHHHFALLRTLRRHINTTGNLASVSRLPYQTKYHEKIAQVAKKKGLSTDELMSQLKEEKAKERLRLKNKDAQDVVANTSQRNLNSDNTESFTSTRRDSSPVKPLSSFFNLSRIMATPHTSEQISALWSAYHASRSNGTGRGYVYATVPAEVYSKMLTVAKKYPNFVVPLERAAPTTEGTLPENPYEFFFLQWSFHENPPVPSTASDEVEQLFHKSNPTSRSSNPPTTALLFTSLQEYKHRQAFATPYLVITHYTDLVQTHGIVLLRGEITPSSTASQASPEIGQDASGRFILSQLDAQMLALSVQKFYLWGQSGKQGGAIGENLLKAFHEAPQEFKWEDLLAYVKSAAP